MNPVRALFSRFYFPRNFPAFIIQFLEYLAHDLGRKAFVRMHSPKCLCQQDCYLGGVWMLASACVFCTKIFIPQFLPCILVHHLKVRLRSSWAIGKKCFVLWRNLCSLYSCVFFLLCSWALLCTCCGYGARALCGYHMGMLLSPHRL